VRTADRESRVPYFHRVPVIGNAFKSKEVRDIRQELLVFITPRIVVNPEIGS
jgi:type II secretory pathway component HofQ